MKVKDYTLLEYFSMQDEEALSEIAWRLKNGKFNKVDHFNTGGYKNASMGFIKLLQLQLGNGSFSWKSFIKAIQDECKLDESLVLNETVYRCKEQIEFLVDQIETVNNLERNNLAGYQDKDSEAAGIDRFNKYGHFIQIDTLANGDVLKYKQIEKEPYMLMFNKLMLEADRSNYNARLAEIRRKKKPRG